MSLRSLYSWMEPTMHQRPRPIHLVGRRSAWVGAILVLIGLAIAAFYESQCGGFFHRCPSDRLPTGPITSQYMLSRPEADLYYPGSRVLKTSMDGQGPDGGLYRPRPAYAQAFLEATASSEQLINWYRQQLQQRGWQFNFQQGTLIDFTRGDRENFDMQVVGDQPPSGIVSDGKGTVYQTYYQITAER
jgi:hypothetical protein